MKEWRVPYFTQTFFVNWRERKIRHLKTSLIYSGTLWIVFTKITQKQKIAYQIWVGFIYILISSKSRLLRMWSIMFFKRDMGLFNLHPLEFTFIYQFYSRKTILVESIFWNSVGLFAFMSFHNHLQLFWYCVLLKIRGTCCLYLFWDTAKWYLNW